MAIAVPVVLSLSACAPATDTTTTGLVSTSLCGDGYALAAGVEIAQLSWQADGPLGSNPGLPSGAWADAEMLVAVQPERLLLGPGERVAEGLLPETDIVQLDWVETVGGINFNLAKLGGDPISSGAETSGKRVLYLSRAGGTAGAGTFVDEAIRLAGATNIVTTPGWFTPDPEWVVAQDPDIIVTSFYGGYESVNATGVRNRAVAEFIAAHPRIDVPGRLWPCGGPGLANAVEIIRDGLG